MSKRARHQPGFYATLLNDVRRCGSNSNYQPKVKPTVMGVYEVECIVAKQVQGGRVLHPMAKLLPEWKYVGTSQALTRGTHHCLREQICWSISHWWMPRETSSFIWEEFKIAPGIRRNYHDTARCSASTLSWFAIRPPWVSVPWSLSEEVFNSNRRRMSGWRSSQLGAVSWQVAFLCRWTKLQNSSPPGTESSDQVYEELFCRTHPVSQMPPNGIKVYEQQWYSFIATQLLIDK